MEHVHEMACWGPLLRLYLAKNIHGISKPRYFRIEMDSDGVVRHHYRAQLQKSKTQKQIDDNFNVGCSAEGNSIAAFDCDKQAQTLFWMPLNTPGFIIFPNGFPPITDIMNVPKKSLNWKGLTKTMKLIYSSITDEAQLWWSTTLTSLEEAEQRYKSSEYYVSNVKI
jgi:hypothetical protein